MIYGFLYHITEAIVSVVPLTGSVVAQRSDHGTSAPPMLQAAASAAGAPLVASPYPQSYLQYNTQQYGQQQVIQAMAPYTGQVKSFLSFSHSQQKTKNKNSLDLSTCRRSLMHHRQYFHSFHRSSRCTPCFRVELG